MGVKQGCPLSPTLFGLCIDQLEDFVSQFLREEEDRPTLGPLLMWLLLYADDVVLFAYSVPSLQRALDAIHAFCAFCEASGFMVNIGKTKIMQVSTNKTEFQPKLMYKGQEIEVAESFKYLGINVPSNHRWGQCVNTRLDAGYAKVLPI